MMHSYVASSDDHLGRVISMMSMLFILCAAIPSIGKKMRLIILLSLRFTINSALFIATGAYHNCALEYSGVKCWGFNEYGRLGYGDTNDRGHAPSEMGASLLEIDLGSDFIPLEIVVGWYHTCALSTTNTVKCWGRNNWGWRLGQGDKNTRGDEANEMGDYLLEIELGTSFKATQVVVGYEFTCALSTTNTVKCFGRNRDGQLGYGDVNDRGGEANEMGDALLEIDLGSDFIPLRIVAGLHHSCALSIANTVKCWGRNAFGALGQGDSNNRGDEANEMGDDLLEIDLGTNFIPMQIVAGSGYTCALSTTNTVKCWGFNEYGQLGYGDTNDRGHAPSEMGDGLLEIDLGSDFIPLEIVVGWYHTCALSTTNTVKCFGRNPYGALGQGDSNNRGNEADGMGDNLLEIDLGSDFIPLEIVVGHYHTCALSTTNTVKCFGSNSYGQLGYGDVNDRGDEADEMGDNLLEIDLG
eukprot:696774_1